MTPIIIPHVQSEACSPGGVSAAGSVSSDRLLDQESSTQNIHTHAHTLVPAMRLTHPSDLLPHSPLLCFSGRFETVNKCVILETFDPRTSATAFLPHGPSARL